MNGNALSNEIQDALGSLGESKKLDEKAKVCVCAGQVCMVLA